jgi:hypothetical protein
MVRTVPQTGRDGRTVPAERRRAPAGRARSRHDRNAARTRPEHAELEWDQWEGRMTSYRIRTVADMLAVPLERRASMLREIEYALDLYDFARGEVEPDPELTLVWTDDGITDVDMSVNGEPLLKLEVREDGPPA